MSIQPEPVPEDEERWPGQDGPLPLRMGGPAVTDAEALGVARRWAKEQSQARGADPGDLPEELPQPNLKKPSSFRIRERTLWLARAKAEMEGRTVTDVVNEHLEEYVRAAPGSRISFGKPRR